MKLRTISEQEFNQIDGPRQVIADEHARVFAALDLGGTLGCYGLGWNSGEFIEPELVLSADGQVVWVGVDQYLTAIDLATGRIHVSLKLHTNLLEIIPLERLTAVRAETEVLLFNPNFSIFFDESFPDITEEISIAGDKLEIRFLEGYSLTLDIQTGKMTRQEFSPLA